MYHAFNESGSLINIRNGLQCDGMSIPDEVIENAERAKAHRARLQDSDDWYSFY